ncbi:MAG: DUF6428 family protein [Leptospirales bacterium]|jgi:hypothetical protein
MKTMTWIESLEAHAQRALRFRLPDGDFVPGNYHITEVKAARSTGVDCGGNARTANETVVQLLAGVTGSSMPGGRAAAIFRKVLDGPAGAEFDPEAELIVEYDGAGGQLSRFPLVDLELDGDTLQARLGRLRSECAPAGERPAGSGACCG